MSLAFPVVVLAGGEGSRIGGGKPLRLLGGETLLDRALRIAAAWTGDVRVAMRTGTEPGPYPLLFDDPAIAGPLGGIASALRYAQGRGRAAVLVIPCDTPFLPADLPHRLSAAVGESRVALAASGGQVHFTCGLWRTEALDGLPAYLSSGRRSLQGFAEQVGVVLVEWETEPLDPFFNVNDEAQLKEAEALLRF